MGTVLFSISLIFQLSGAILLILSYFSNTKRKVAYKYFWFEGFVKCVGKNPIRWMIADKERIKDILQDIYINRVAFIYLLIGYAITVFGENQSENKLLLALIVVLISVLLSVLTLGLIGNISKRDSISSKYLFFDDEDISVGAHVAVLDEQE